MAKNSRQTRQKKELEKAIASTRPFFTAEDLHDQIRKRHPEIGLATIYRHLKNMRAEHAIYFYKCDGRLVYSKEKKSHCHFICEETGKIIHFDIDSLDFLKNKIPGTIDSFQLEVHGTCENCKKECSKKYPQ